MGKKDYYEVLGVDRQAGAKEVKSAYRRQAVQNHPDRNPGDPVAEARFKEAAEAYAVLSDPGKRQRYDQFRHQTNGNTTVRTAQASSQGGDFSDIMSDFFGFGAGGFGQPQQRSPLEKAVESVNSEITFRNYRAAKNKIEQIDPRQYSAIRMKIINRVYGKVQEDLRSPMMIDFRDLRKDLQGLEEITIMLGDSYDRILNEEVRETVVEGVKSGLIYKLGVTAGSGLFATQGYLDVSDAKKMARRLKELAELVRANPEAVDKATEKTAADTIYRSFRIGIGQGANLFEMGSISETKAVAALKAVVEVLPEFADGAEFTSTQRLAQIYQQERQTLIKTFNQSQNYQRKELAKITKFFADQGIRSASKLHAEMLSCID